MDLGLINHKCQGQMLIVTRWQKSTEQDYTWIGL